jgi:hypothetical protein
MAVKPVRSRMPTTLGSQGLTAIAVAHNSDIEISPADLHLAVAP